MFNDKFGLTQAVLEGRKTQTRRIIECRKTFKGEWVAGFNIHIRPSDKKVVGLPCMYDADEREFDGGVILPKYKIGEVVAVAQSYKDAGVDFIECDVRNGHNHLWGNTKGMKSWNNKTPCGNKMFVLPEAMPNRIRITNVRIQRLQDISDDDCLKEGLEWDGVASQYYVGYEKEIGRKTFLGKTPREAFAHLINEVSKKGTWDSNPYVWVYDFELVK